MAAIILLSVSPGLNKRNYPVCVTKLSTRNVLSHVFNWSKMLCCVASRCSASNVEKIQL